MRLLNTTTFELTFFAADRPPYAILSHRWEYEEVTFQDLVPGGRAAKMKGWSKLENSARLAREEGLGYIWVDTCCIDKSSSAELSEAINSMFRWYKECDRCIAFLSDVRDMSICDSVWFTRGWTLQELIAPRDCYFYDAFWEFRGTKQSLKHQIHSVTGITPDVLLGTDLRTVPACRKMSWAAGRNTTRAEDLAYCLMGLFDVNMPLLYGEGFEKAFRRLQEIFVRESDDESIFAWMASADTVAEKHYWGLLAASPDYFKRSGNYAVPEFKVWRQGLPTEVTSKGLRVSLTLEPLAGDTSGTLFLAPINCAYQVQKEDQIMSAFTILLQKLSDFEDQFARVRPDKITPVKDNSPDIPSDAGQILRTHQVFVKPVPQITDPVIGFSANSKQVIGFDFLKNSPQGPVPLQGTARAQCTGAEPWKVMGMQSPRLSLEMNKSSAELDPTKYDVRNLGQRQLLGSLEVIFSSTIIDNGRTLSMSSTKKALLLLGFEALPENCLGTTSGYVKPWYAFSSADTVNISNLESPGNALQATLDAPGGCRIGVVFAPATHRFKTFYDVKFSNANRS